MKQNSTAGIVALVTIMMLATFAMTGAHAVPNSNGNTDQENACWGQASAVFARAGEMGVHASEQEEPRWGLSNLANELYDMGVIAEPTLQALGAFVAAEWGMTIDACQ